jgi:NAD(P)-dependent dehydrogenase (short-subunit alcohol dehydrogenase family)
VTVDLGSSTVIVTGAASGIGKALAEGFLTEGSKVVAVDLEREWLAGLAKLGAITMPTDVSDPRHVQDMIDDTLDATGRVDVLINNAGVGVSTRIEQHGPDEFERVLRVNLFGPFYGMRSAIPVMRQQGYGRIINLVSRHAEAGIPGMGAYGSSKAALWQLTRTAANEVQDTDILVNALIPGPTKSGMNPAGTQPPELVYPTARMLASLPAGGPSGKVFWEEREYLMFQPVKRRPGEE